MPSATATLAIRPPKDFPPTQTGSPPPPRSVAASKAARTVATAIGSRSGERLPASMYGKLNRIVATPSSAIARAKPAMNGWSMPAPAPWNSASEANASRGRTYAAHTVPFSGTSIVNRSSGVGMRAIMHAMTAKGTFTWARPGVASTAGSTASSTRRA